MVTEAPTRGVILVTSLFTLSCICLILFVWSTIGGNVPLQPQGYRFTAVFEDASQLNKHAAVRISGVDVGHVVKVKPVGLNTIATIEVDARYAPIPTDTKAILRNKTLLGETFVALTPGSRGAPRVPDGGALSRRNIGYRQPLDRLLASFDPRTRRNLQKLLIGTSETFDGRGDQLNSAFGDLDPTSEALAKLATIVDHQSGSVRSLVRDSATVLNVVAARDSDVAGLVNNGNAVLSTTADRNRALTATVRALPGLTTQLRSTMRSLDETAALATPTLTALEPGAKSAPAAVRKLSALAPRATRLFRDFNKLVPTAKKALPATGRIIDAITPFANQLYPVVRDLVPITNYLGARKVDVVGAVISASLHLQATLTSNSGQPAHYLRSLIPIDDRGLTGDKVRPGTDRHNPYPAPGEFARVGKEGMRASDCRNVKNPPPVFTFGSGAPPCVVQPGWSFGGAPARYYPHLEALPPQR
jgi:phospholipid/cholesterol/gamma-HCH transport system substrate-binding protein